MTDEAPETEVDWTATEAWDGGDEDSNPEPPKPPMPVVTTAALPPGEYPLTLGFRPGAAPTLTLRGFDPDGLKVMMDHIESSGLWSAIGNHMQLANAQGAVGAGLGATTPVPEAPQAAPSVPQQGGWGSAPQAAPAAGGWGSQPPAQGGWGGASNGGGTPGRNDPKPRPTDWGPNVFQVSVPPNRKDEWKSFREQWKEQLKGKVRWAGKGDYWVHPETLPGLGAWNPRQV